MSGLALLSCQHCCESRWHLHGQRPPFLSNQPTLDMVSIPTSMPRENHQKEDLFPPAMLSDAACECEVPKRGRRHIKPGVYACLNCGRIIPKPPRRRPPPPPPGNGEGAIGEEEHKIRALIQQLLSNRRYGPSNCRESEAILRSVLPITSHRRAFSAVSSP